MIYLSKQPPRRLFPVDTDEREGESEVESAEDSDEEMVEEIKVEESDLSEPRRILRSTGLTQCSYQGSRLHRQVVRPVKKEHLIIDKKGPVESLDKVAKE